jgi:hypothetical protein
MAWEANSITIMAIQFLDESCFFVPVPSICNFLPGTSCFAHECTFLWSRTHSTQSLMSVGKT